MTNAERHEARYQRRKAARMAKRQEKVGDALDFDKVFSFAHLYRSAYACFKGVSWKASVQAYKSRCGINVKRRHRELEKGKFTLKKSPEFYVRERGHLRRINSIHIEDRVPQKCNSKYALKPVLHRSLVYDNYASQEKKGTSKARKRLKCRLERHIRKYGLTGGVLVLDLKGFFDSIQHKLVQWVMMRNFDDLRIVGVNMRIVRLCRKNVGLVLSRENSQDFAIATPNSLDHYIAEVLRVEGLGRYMDDIVIIDPDYSRLKEVYSKIKAFAARLGFTLNEKKSRLVRFGKQFTVLKRKYDFTETGHIIVRPARESVVRERRKLKKLHGKIARGELPFSTAVDSLQAWEASIDDTKCYGVKRQMEELFDRLFIKDWLAGKEDGVCITKSSPAEKSLMCATA